MIVRTTKQHLTNSLFKGKAAVIYGARQVKRDNLLDFVGAGQKAPAPFYRA